MERDSCGAKRTDDELTASLGSLQRIMHQVQGKLDINIVGKREVERLESYSPTRRRRAMALALVVLALRCHQR